MRTPNQYIRDLGKRAREQRGVFILYSILRLLVVLIAIRTIMLHNYEATVRCITHRLDDLIGGLTYGEEYKAIGRDKAGLFLVKDDSECCYFYNPSDFVIVDDPYGILSRRSVYYSYYGGEDEIRKY